MASTITFECARSDCDAREVAEVTAEDLDRQIQEFLEDGWGADLLGNGVDRVIHCPEHRDPVLLKPRERPPWE